jgi:hypothetical protein
VYSISIHACQIQLYNHHHPECTLLFQTVADISRPGWNWPAQDSLTARAITIAPSRMSSGRLPLVQYPAQGGTAAHLADHVFPRMPVRQRVLLVSKRLRYFMQHDGAVLSMVLRIFLRVIEHGLRTHSPGAAHVDTYAAPRQTNCTSRRWN